jgi:hypothetical protein
MVSLRRRLFVGKTGFAAVSCEVRKPFVLREMSVIIGKNNRV